MLLEARNPAEKESWLPRQSFCLDEVLPPFLQYVAWRLPQDFYLSQSN